MTAEPIDLLCLDTSRRIGGGGVCLERVLLRLDPGTIRATIACPPRSALGERLAAAGLRVLPWVPTSRSHPFDARDLLAAGVSRRLVLPFASAVTVARLAAWSAARPRTVLHANTFQAAVLAAAVAAITSRPFLYHDRILKSHGALERWICRRAHRVLAPSRTGAAKWGDRFREKTRVLVDGTDLATFQPTGDRSLRDRIGAGASDFVVVSVSRLTREKTLELLIEAVARLPRETMLLIAGEPCLPEDHAYLGELEALAARLDVRTRFLGFVENVPRLLEAADLFVLPSPKEMFGQVILEAMAMERPAVASRSYGPAEIIEDGRTGLLFLPGDVADLAAKIAEMGADPERRKAMGAEARRVLVERYSLERTVAQFTEIVESAARRGPSGRP